MAVNQQQQFALELSCYKLFCANAIWFLAFCYVAAYRALTQTVLAGFCFGTFTALHCCRRRVACFRLNVKAAAYIPLCNFAGLTNITLCPLLLPVSQVVYGLSAEVPDYAFVRRVQHHSLVTQF